MAHEVQPRSSTSDPITHLVGGAFASGEDRPPIASEKATVRGGFVDLVDAVRKINRTTKRPRFDGRRLSESDGRQT